MLSTFTIDTFSTGDIFKVFYGQGQYVEIILVQVSASKYKNLLSKTEPFLLVFQSNEEVMIEAGCYNMTQEKVGSFEMAITPTMPLNGDWKSNYYEAAFS